MKKGLLLHVISLSSTTNSTSYMYYGNFSVRNQQNAEEVFSRSNLLHGASDLSGVVDVGVAIQKELE